MRTHYAGCRALFYAVIVQAIRDALLYKKPRFNKETITEGERKFRKKVKTLLPFLIRNYHLSNREDLMIFMVLNMWTRIEKIMDHDPASFESKSYKARQFLNLNNPHFIWYCERVSLDPNYVIEKINKCIKAFDEGDKNILKNVNASLDILKVNTL